MNQTTPSRQNAWPTTLVLIGLVLAMIGYSYRETLAAMAEIWWRSDTYGHGFLVPVISGWLAWRSRHRLVNLAPGIWLLPFVPLACMVFAWLLGDLTAVNALTQFSVVAIIVLACAALLGKSVSRQLAFPLLFLFFAVPIGDFLMPKLMEWTADFTVIALRLSGIPVYREGQNFVVPSGNWSVVEACSGIRYLIASLTVGTLYAYLTYTSLKRRLIFVGISLLVPVVANWLRAYLIVMIGHLSGNKLAVGVDHLIYGWVFFGVVIFLMFWVGSRWQEEPAPVQPAPAQAEPTRWARVVPIALALAAFQPALALLDRPIDVFAVTLAAPAPAEGWTTALEERFAYVPHYAGARAQLRTVYWSEDHPAPVALFAAWYIGQREGQEMIAWENGPASHVLGDLQLVRSARAMTVAGVPVVENFISTPSGRVLTWHWYRLNDRELARDAEVKLRLAIDRLTGRADESAVVVLSTPVAEAGAERARAHLEAFLAAHAGAIRATLEAPAASIPR